MIIPDKKTIGNRLRQYRGDRTQLEVAQAIGVTKMAISSYESGKRIPTDKTKAALAEYFGCSVESLFFAM